MTQVDTTHPSLLRRLRDRRDDDSWRDFQSRYGRLLYRYARGHGAAHAEAEDVAQEVTMQFVRAAPGFEYDRNRGRFRGYLRASVIRELARRSKSKRRQPIVIDGSLLADLAPDSIDDELWQREWWLHRLRQATERVATEFDPVTVKAFEMHVLAAVPVAETSAKLGISKWKIYRARRRILRRLAVELGEDQKD